MTRGEVLENCIALEENGFDDSLKTKKDSATCVKAIHDEYIKVVYSNPHYPYHPYHI